MTLFYETAMRLMACGYSIIPIIPGEKRPGTWNGSEWRGLTDWTRFCDRVPTQFELDMWAKWPEPSICVALGRASGICAVDYDYADGALLEALEAILPPSPVVKMGAKGKTAFYRGYALVSRKNMVDGVVANELLSHGRQSVLPPSRHPDGMNYRWLTDLTLENTTAPDLPELPRDYHNLVDEIITRFQTQPLNAPKRQMINSPHNANADGQVFVSQEDSYWRMVNQTALDNLAMWVPALLPQAKRGAKGGYRCTPDWRDVEKNTPKVSINPSGIVDFGNDERMTAIDLVIRVTGADAPTATDWLVKRLGINTEPLFTPLETPPEHPPEPESEPEATILPFPTKTPPWRAALAPETGASVGTAYPPKGALGMLVDYITRTSFSHQPVLNLGASICAIGTLAGRKYKSPTNLRTNIYAVGLAASGAGKEHARTVIDRLFSGPVGVPSRLGATKIASGQGLLTEVTRQPAILFLIDEFGAFLQGIANRQKAPRHLTEILDNMTQLFTSAEKTFRGTAYANQKDRPKQEIVEPCMSIYGTTVPSNFWNALESNAAMDGSLARFLIFETRVSFPDPSPIDDSPPSPEMIDMLKRIATPVGGGNLDGHQSGHFPPNLMEVSYSADGAVLLRELQMETLKIQRKYEDTNFSALWARRMELIIKVAMIHAVGCMPEDPKIIPYDVHFAKAVVDESIEFMMAGIQRHVSDNVAESYSKKVVEIVRKSKNQEIGKNELCRKTQWLGRERDHIMKGLVESEILMMEIIETGKRPRTVYRIRNNAAI